MDNEEIDKKAKEWIRVNVSELIKKFASVEKFPPVKNPFSMFMAGSPGAGKTEFSK